MKVKHGYFVADMSETRLAMFFKDWQLHLIDVLSTHDELSSRDVWVKTQERMGGSNSISRASVINFCNAMVEAGVFNYTETTGKGGHRRIYSRAFGTQKDLKDALYNAMAVAAQSLRL